MTDFTSEATVLVNKFQQITSDDLTASSTLGQATTDHVVATFLAAGQAYTGLAVTANADAKGVTVGTAGSTLDILYNLGGGYPLRAPAPIDLADLINAIPDTTLSMIVLIVASGGTTRATEARTLEDASKQPANPEDLWPTTQQVITTRVVRACTPDIVPGVAAVTPAVPAYNPLLCLLATVTINKTGVVSVAQNTAAQITRLDKLGPLVAAQGAQLSANQQIIAGLLSSVASLSAAFTTQGQSFAAQLLALQQAIAALESRQVTTSTNSILTITDYYSDGSGLTAGSGYTVGSGLAFPQTNKNPVSYFPLQTVGPNVKVLGNRYLTLPYTETTTNDRTSPYSAQLRMGSEGLWNVTPQLVGFGVARTRYGATYQAQSAAQLLSSASPAALFSIAGDLAYDPSWRPWTSFAPELNHQNGYWHDTAARGTWAPRSALPATGNVNAVSHLYTAPFDDMITSMTVACAQFAVGTARMLVCEDASGAPDPTAVLMDVSASQGPTGDAPLKFVFPYPHLRKAGKRYHYVILTNGNATLYTQPIGLGSGNQVYPVSANTILLHRTVNGGWQQDANGEILYVDYTRATFSAGTPIELNSLTGGQFDALDILTPAIVPPGCDIVYGTIPNGSTSYQRFGAIDPANPASNLLAGRPSFLRLLVELLTTGNTAPVIDLQASASGTPGALIAQQSGTLTAESPVRTPTSSVTTITRQVTLSGFNPAIHTYTEVLEPGPAFTPSATNPVIGTPVVQADGTTLLTFKWVLGTAIPSFKVKYLGTTSNTAQQFTMTKSITTATP